MVSRRLVMAAGIATAATEKEKLKKYRKHSSAARVFYVSLVFSNVCLVLSRCNTRLRLLYLLTNEF